MKISKIANWLLRMFVYACMGTSAILLVYNFENDCWFCSGDYMTEKEGKHYIGSINKGQQFYYVENNKFSNSIDNLGIGIKTDTNNYSYRILSPMNPVQNVEELKLLPVEKERAIAFATPKILGFKSYMGIASTLQNSDGKITATTKGICQTGEEGILYPSILPEISDDQISCPPGFEILR